MAWSYNFSTAWINASTAASVVAQEVHTRRAAWFSSTRSHTARSKSSYSASA